MNSWGLVVKEVKPKTMIKEIVMMSRNFWRIPTTDNN
jgi:hypothetical protein